MGFGVFRLWAGLFWDWCVLDSEHLAFRVGEFCWFIFVRTQSATGLGPGFPGLAAFRVAV